MYVAKKQIDKSLTTVSLVARSLLDRPQSREPSPNTRRTNKNLAVISQNDNYNNNAHEGKHLYTLSQILLNKLIFDSVKTKVLFTVSVERIITCTS